MLKEKDTKVMLSCFLNNVRTNGLLKKVVIRMAYQPWQSGDSSVFW